MRCVDTVLHIYLLYICVSVLLKTEYLNTTKSWLYLFLQNDTATLRVQVLNVNDWDPRFRYPQYEFYVTSTTLRPGDAVGTIEVADGDRGDQISLTVMGEDAR